LDFCRFVSSAIIVAEAAPITELGDKFAPWGLAEQYENVCTATPSAKPKAWRAATAKVKTEAMRAPIELWLDETDLPGMIRRSPED